MVCTIPHAISQVAILNEKSCLYCLLVYVCIGGGGGGALQNIYEKGKVIYHHVPSVLIASCKEKTTSETRKKEL